jgi:RimJ/RimL family protein N-acetyltransferase
VVPVVEIEEARAIVPRPRVEKCRSRAGRVEQTRAMVPRTELRSRDVVLEPLTLAHVDVLLAAASEDRATYGFTWVPNDAASTLDYIETALTDERAGEALPFAVRLPGAGRVVGSTRFLDLAYWDDTGVPNAVEIGHTWLAASVQGTRVNPAMKLLMLAHAFDTWNVERVTFKTDARNQQSRHAIDKLGARFEGVRRAHKLASDGSVRDSAYFSIIRAEWPEVREQLTTRLERPAVTVADRR